MTRTMRIDELWRELEQDARLTGADGWLIRHALPAPQRPLLVALDARSGARALLLRVKISDVPHRREWPVCSGLEIGIISLDGVAHLAIRLVDPASSDVFVALAQDVAPKVAAVASDREAATTLFARLRRWQRFLAAAAAGLSIERQRGLFGELHALKNLFAPASGPMPAVAAWRSPKRSHQDFQFGAAATEVKTTTSKQPVCVRITSERQLDCVGTRALFLYVLVLDEREAEETARAGTGETLPDIVRDIRAALPPDVLDLFNDRLLDFGYLDSHAHRYEARRFAKRSEHAFRISSGFPRLIESSLPPGVGNVSYELSLAACHPFEVTLEEMLAAIGSCVV